MKREVTVTPTRIPEEVVADVREHVNIVDVISPYVQLKKQGRNLFGVCPFHEERTPSFSVNEEKQIFHCFSCGRGGNAFTFLMDLKGLSFPQAVVQVAQEAGIDLPDQYQATTVAPKVDQQTQALRDLYADAAKLYHHLLVNTTSGEPALSYLQQRGLDDQTIDAFMLGYAPSQDVLLAYFTNKAVDYQLLRASKLFVEWDDGSLHDRFTDRVLFTIRDQNGHPIAFSGRRLTDDSDQPKYINSPESQLFDKSQEVFNLDLAKASIKQSKEVVLFEGYMDVLAAFQAGVTNGVASMGTSLTPQQVQQLAHLADRIKISYDADQAGQKATARALSLIKGSSLKPVIVHIPNQQDPDEYLRSHDAASLVQVLQEHLEDPITFQLRYLKANRNMGQQQDRLAYLDDALKVIAEVKEPVARETYLQRLADDYSVSMEALKDQLRPLLMAKRAHQAQGPSEYDTVPTASPVVGSPHQRPSRLEQAEQALLAWMLRDEQIWLTVTNLAGFQFADVNYETLLLLASAYRDEQSVKAPLDLNGFMDFVKKPELTRILVDLEAIPDELFARSDLVDDYINVIMREEPLVERIQSLKRQLTEAQQMQDMGRVAQLSIELIQALKEKQVGNEH